MSHTKMLDIGGLRGGPRVAYSSQSGQNNLVDGSMLDVHIPTFEPAQS